MERLFLNQNELNPIPKLFHTTFRFIYIYIKRLPIFLGEMRDTRVFHCNPYRCNVIETNKKETKNGVIMGNGNNNSFMSFVMYEYLVSII